MSTLPAIKLRYNFEDTYAGSWTTQGVGAQTAPYRRGWYPAMPLFTGGSVRALCRVKKWLYIGGDFTGVNGLTTTPRLCRMSLEDGVIDTTWAPSPTVSVICMATDGERLWVGGSFLSIGGVSRAYSARFAANGALDDWAPALDHAPLAMAHKTGTSNVYIGGTFSAIGSDARLGVAEVDDVGIATTFDAAISGGFPVVNAVAYDLNQNMLYMGGTFGTVGATTRHYAAKVDGDTGALQAWNPNPDLTVVAIAIKYPLVYLGGSFSTMTGGPLRSGLARIDQAGALDLSFDATGVVAAHVRSISLSDDGERIFACGDAGFTDYVAGMDTTGASLPWDLGIVASNAFVVLNYKNTVFAGGGSMTSVNGVGSTTTTVSNAASIPFPLFRDTDTIFVKKTGTFEDAGVGTYADPKRSMAGAIGTTASFNDQSGSGFHLTLTGTVHHQWEGWTKPLNGYWMAGIFDDSSYLNIPSGVGTAIAASNKFTAQFKVWFDSLAAINTVWDYQDATAETVVFVNTDGSLGFNLRGTTATSAAGVIQEKKPYTITVEKNSSGNLKRAWITEPGKNAVLVINTTQATTMGAHTSNRLCKDRSNANRFLVGYLGAVHFFDAAVAGSLGVPLDWRDGYHANCVAYYPMQSLSALEGDTAMRYVCVLDSEVYEEAFNWHVEGTSLYAADGCAPTFRPRVGPKPGTYGARKRGREKFSTGAGSTFIYVSKTGNDSTGARGNSELPFLTLAGAAAAAGITANDTVEIQDSGVYTEDLNFSVAVTIQAADEEIPTIRQPVAGSTFFTGTFNFYGVVIVCQAYSFSTGTMAVWDCTLSGLSLAASAALTVVNCSGATVSAGSAATVYIENCFNCSMNHQGATGVSTITHCNMVSMDWSSGGTDGGSCYFQYCSIGIDVNLQPGSGGGNYNMVNLFRCTFSVGRLFLNLATSGAAAKVRNQMYVSGCLSQDCAATAIAAFDARESHSINSNATDWWVCFVNCAVVGSVWRSFTWDLDQNVTRLRMQNFTSIDAGDIGVYFGNLPTNYSFSAIASTGSVGNDLQGAGTTTVTFTTATKIDANFPGADEADPVFLSDVPGAVNLALSAISPCMFTGDADGNSDQGCSWAWINNQVAGASLEGFRIEDEITWGGGLSNTPGVSTLPRFVTASGLGLAGFLGAEGMIISNCEGAQTNGPAFRMGGVSALVERSIAWSCSGAGFVWGGVDLSASHNSSWGCEYGHYDNAAATGLMEDEIHSDCGTDAVANETADYSDVGTLGETTAVGTGATRDNPLYVDPFNGDLSLQTEESGYPENSPAKGTASDDGDMGAYEAEYAPLSQDFNEISFDQTDPAGVRWRNPDDRPHELVPVKLSEGDKPLGGFFSEAKAIKNQWTLTWNTMSNPMPEEQRIALQEVFASAGTVQVAFDGCTWITCVVVKSVGAQDDQIDQAYSNSEIPRPYATLVLREA